MRMQVWYGLNVYARRLWGKGIRFVWNKVSFSWHDFGVYWRCIAELNYGSNWETFQISLRLLNINSTPRRILKVPSKFLRKIISMFNRLFKGSKTMWYQISSFCLFIYCPQLIRYIGIINQPHLLIRWTFASWHMIYDTNQGGIKCANWRTGFIDSEGSHW